VKKPLRDQIDELAAMGVAELERQHLKLFGEEPASAHRQFLFRKIAWRVQADREGGLPESARELARAIAKDAPLRNRVISNALRTESSGVGDLGMAGRAAHWRLLSQILGIRFAFIAAGDGSQSRLGRASWSTATSR
jgi:hypothetical protein